MMLNVITNEYSFINSFILSISIAPFKVTAQERSRFQYGQKGKFLGEHKKS